MFLVQIRIPRETGLVDEMTAMRAWLDHERYEPTTFRYTFEPPGVLFQVDFTTEAEAAAFAKAFQGVVIEARPVNGIVPDLSAPRNRMADLAPKYVSRE